MAAAEFVTSEFLPQTVCLVGGATSKAFAGGCSETGTADVDWVTDDAGAGVERRGGGGTLKLAGGGTRKEDEVVEWGVTVAAPPPVFVLTGCTPTVFELTAELVVLSLWR